VLTLRTLKASSRYDLLPNEFNDCKYRARRVNNPVQFEPFVRLVKETLPVISASFLRIELLFHREIVATVEMSAIESA
jgi:hypothetical protein